MNQEKAARYKDQKRHLQPGFYKQLELIKKCVTRLKDYTKDPQCPNALLIFKQKTKPKGAVHKKELGRDDNGVKKITRLYYGT